MFRGLNLLVLDPKGRISLPSRYRDQFLSHITPQFIVSIDTESPCLLLYPFEEWIEIELKIQNLPSFNPIARRIQRLLIGHATELEMDGKGRILIPSLLREYAHFDKKIIVVGQGKKFEMWDEKIWNEQRQLWLTDTKKAQDFPEDLQTLSL